MAIYHFSVKTISRGNGRSAVACAAYRSGEKLVCDFMEKNKTTQKKLVSNLQKSMHLKIQILSYSIVRHFGTSRKSRTKKRCITCKRI
jgi:hypothetical protein